MPIFKHMTVEGCLRLLRTKAIRVTQPEALNDILECRPALCGIADERGLREIAPNREAIERMMHEGVDKVLAQLSPESRARLPPHVGEEFLRNMIVNSGLTEQAQRLTVALAGALEPIAGPLMHKKINEYVGVLSFTSRADSASMWDRYSDRHRGVAVVFDDAHEFFHSRPGMQESPMNLKRVDYVTAKDSKHMIDLDVHELFFQKTNDWEYEQEVRMVRLLRDVRATGSKDLDGYEVFVVDLPVEAVRGVIYGLRSSGDDRRNVDAMLNAESYAHVQRFEMQRVDGGARLAVVPAIE